MNGPQHYAEADRILDELRSRASVRADEAQVNVLAAQAHATLALVAITAEAAIGEPDPESWLPVTA